MELSPGDVFFSGVWRRWMRGRKMMLQILDLLDDMDEQRGRGEEFNHGVLHLEWKDWPVYIGKLWVWWRLNTSIEHSSSTMGSCPHLSIIYSWCYSYRSNKKARANNGNQFLIYKIKVAEFQVRNEQEQLRRKQYDHRCRRPASWSERWLKYLLLSMKGRVDRVDQALGMWLTYSFRFSIPEATNALYAESSAHLGGHLF